MQINPYVIFSDIHTEAVQAALAKHKEQKMALPMPTKRRSTFVQSPADACTPPGRFIGTFLFDSYCLGIWTYTFSFWGGPCSSSHIITWVCGVISVVTLCTAHSIPRPVHSTASFWIPALTGLRVHTHVISRHGPGPSVRTIWLFCVTDINSLISSVDASSQFNSQHRKTWNRVLFH